MRPFVGGQAVQMLVRRAGVVDFVEVGGVVVAGILRDGVLLVEEKIRRAHDEITGVLRDRDGQCFGGFGIKEADLHQLQTRRDRGEAHEASAFDVIALVHTGQRRVVFVHGIIPQPAEDFALPVLGVVRLGPRLAVLGDFHGEIAVADVSVVGQAEIAAFSQIEHDLFVGTAGRPRGLGRLRRAEIDERHNGVDQRYRRHQKHVPAVQMELVIMLSAKVAHAWGFRFLGAADERVFVLQHADVKGCPAQENGVEYIDGGDNVVQPVLACLQMTEICRRHAALQHENLIQKQRCGQRRQRDQDALVAGMDVAERQQQKGGEDVALVNHRAEGADQHDQRAADQRQMTAVLRCRAQHGAVEVAQRKADPCKDGHAGMRGGVRPVESEEIVEIQRIDRHALVALHRAGVQIDQPFHRRVQRREDSGGEIDGPEAGDQSEQVQNAQRRRRADQRADGISAPADVEDNDGEQTQRREQQRLRLDQHRQRETDEGRDVLLIRSVQRAQRNQQREDGVDLSPCGRVGDHGGIEGEECSQQQRGASAQLWLSLFPDQPCGGEVEQNRPQLQKNQMRAGAVGEAQQRLDSCDGRKHPHVQRRIIAPHAGVVEHGRADIRHVLRPAGEAVDVGVVAGDHRSEDQAQRKCGGKEGIERAAVAVPSALRAAAVFLGKGQHSQHVHAGQQHIHFRVARRFSFIIDGGQAAFGFPGRRREVLNKRACGGAVQPDHLEIVEPRAAAVFVAVAADAGEDGQFGLVLAGAADDFKGDPLAARVAGVVRIAEGVLDGNRRADALSAHAAGSAHAGDAVERVRLDFDGLGKAGVVDPDIADGDAAAFVAVLLHAEEAHTLVGEPHLAAPSGGIEAADLGKIAVGQQIFLRVCGEGEAQNQKRTECTEKLAHERSPWIFCSIYIISIPEPEIPSIFAAEC